MRVWGVLVFTYVCAVHRSSPLRHGAFNTGSSCNPQSVLV